MFNEKTILKNKCFWWNYFSTLALYTFFMPNIHIYKSLIRLSDLDKIGLSIYLIIGFLLIYTFIVSLHFVFIWPMNRFINNISDSKNIIYNYFSALILIPQLLISPIEKKFNIDIAIVMFSFSSIVLVCITIFYLRAKLDKIGTWITVLCNSAIWILLFPILMIAQALSFALLAKWMYELRTLIFF